MNITLGDGRQFLNRCTNRYDAVVLDAFLGDSSPAHLMTREAFASMRDVLNRKGAGHQLLWGHAAGTGLLPRLSHQDPARRLQPCGTSRFGERQRLYVASQAPLHLSPDRSPVHSLLVRDTVVRVLARTQETDPLHGRVLTDDFNPVEFHDAANRERLRRNLARTCGISDPAPRQSKPGDSLPVPVTVESAPRNDLGSIIDS